MTRFGIARLLPPAVVMAGVLATDLSLTAGAPALALNAEGYFETRGANVLVFSNWYSGEFSDSKLSGVELIHHGVRTATNGDVRLSATPGQWDPIPQLVRRDIDRSRQVAYAELAYPKDGFTYRVEVTPSGSGVLISVHLPAPLPEPLEGRAGFNLEFLPSAYFGRSYDAGGRAGMFARHPEGPLVKDSRGTFDASPLASASRLVLAPEDPARRVTIEALGSTLSLYDGRNTAQNGWFVVRSLLPAGKAGLVLQWLVVPHRIPGWVRRPVIAHSQVGYHPKQSKIALIETDPNDTSETPVRLLQIHPDGRSIERLSGAPAPWGRYLRYAYARFDFSSVAEPGLYALERGDVRTEPFRIAPDVYQHGIWQHTLDTFLPVQMDHVRVNDRYRVWHGASHLDDARQAPPDHVHFDLYAQGPGTDSPYQPGQHIPGLDAGGWFDAGDFDIRTQSVYTVVSTLVLARETFGIDRDQTTVDQQNRIVELGRPDGVPDIVQQIEHGALALVSQYRSVGHAIPGIVEPDLGQYTHLGDAVTKTDGLVYNPALAPGATRERESGTPDDRWAFTSRSTALDYGAIAALAAASRALRGYNESLADECLRTAVRVWDEEQSREPARFHHGNTTGGRLEIEELKATVELLVTSKGARRYADRLAATWPTLESRFAEAGTLVARAIPYMDGAFREKVRAAVLTYKPGIDAELAKNPFGVPIATGGWGGSGSVLGFAMGSYVMHRAFPDIIGPDYTLRAIGYVLGTHPGSDVSLVSGVGARSMTIAYGSNRADFSFIPGGVVPGIVIVKPDFPELKEDWPFLWFENEYVVTAGALLIYAAHAAQALVQ
jgi:hypothetical protein